MGGSASHPWGWCSNLQTCHPCTQRRQWHPTPVLLPGKSHGRRSLVGCSPWGHKELDMTERLHFHFSLSCIGEGNGNPLQCSCLENPRNWGAWWAAIYRVTQSRTRLERLSSSSSSSIHVLGCPVPPGSCTVSPTVLLFCQTNNRVRTEEFNFLKFIKKKSTFFFCFKLDYKLLYFSYNSAELLFEVFCF